MSGDLRLPRSPVFGDDYWLCRCNGFRVDTPDGHFGVVADVRFGSRLDRPDELVVRGGLFGSRVVVVSVAEVAGVLPREERVTLKRAASAPGEHVRLARLRTHLARHAGSEGG